MKKSEVVVGEYYAWGYNSYSTPTKVKVLEFQPATEVEATGSRGYAFTRRLESGWKIEHEDGKTSERVPTRQLRSTWDDYQAQQLARKEASERRRLDLAAAWDEYDEQVELVRPLFAAVGHELPVNPDPHTVWTWKERLVTGGGMYSARRQFPDTDVEVPLDVLVQLAGTIGVD